MQEELRSRLRSLGCLALALALSGCDAWPTVVNNQTEAPIKLRYLVDDESKWSGGFLIAAGKAQRLAREHWVQDIVGVHIEERGKTYALSFRDLTPMRQSCPSNSLARRLKLAPDCYVNYLGDGRLRGSFEEPKGLTFQNLTGP